MKTINIAGKGISPMRITIPSNAKTNSKGDTYTVCPFCSDGRLPAHKKLPVLGINQGKGTWRCNHCGKDGAIISDQDYEKIGIKSLSKSSEDLQRYTLIENDPEIVTWFLEKRKLKINALKEMRLKTCNRKLRIKYSKKESEIGTFQWRKCIAYPFLMDDQIINIQYRDVDKNFSMETGADSIFFNLNSVKKETKEAIITEGMNDVGAFIEAGFSKKGFAILSVPNGVTITPDEIEYYKQTGVVKNPETINLTYLTKCYNKIDHIETFYIATDNDPAGIKLRMALIKRLGEERCKIVDFGQWEGKDGKPINDANQLLIEKGVNYVNQSIESAAYVPSPDIYDIKSNLSTLNDYYVNGNKRGTPLGVWGLDGRFSHRYGHFVALNGYGNAGKTSFLIWYAMLCSLHPDINAVWGIYSPENYPVESFIDQLVEVYIGNTLNIDDPKRMSKHEYNKALRDFISERFYIINREEGFTPDEFRELKKSMIRRVGCNSFISGPWNAFIENLKPGQSENKWLQEQLSKEQRFAEFNNVYNLHEVHPSTPVKSKTNDGYKHPGKFDIAGGVIWNNKLYDQICINREDDTDYTNTTLDIFIQKIKFQKLCGIPNYDSNPIKLRFSRRTGRYIDAKGIDIIEQLVKARNKREQEKIEDTQLIFSDEFSNI